MKTPVTGKVAEPKKYEIISQSDPSSSSPKIAEPPLQKATTGGRLSWIFRI